MILIQAERGPQRQFRTIIAERHDDDVQSIL